MLVSTTLIPTPIGRCFYLLLLLLIVYRDTRVSHHNLANTIPYCGIVGLCHQNEPLL